MLYNKDKSREQIKNPNKMYKKKGSNNMELKRKVKINSERLRIIREFFGEFLESDIIDVMQNLTDEQIKVIDTAIQKLYVNPNSQEVFYTRRELILLKGLLDKIQIDEIESHIAEHKIDIDGWDIAIELARFSRQLDDNFEDFQLMSIINEIQSTVTELIVEDKQNIWLEFTNILIEVRERETCKAIEDCRVWIDDWNADRIEQLTKMLNKLKSMKGSR